MNVLNPVLPQGDGPSVKFVTVQAGARDHYQVPVALAEGGMLARFVTDAYATQDGSLKTSIAKKFLPGISSRYAAGLDGSQVVIDGMAFSWSILEKLASKHRFFQRVHTYVQSAKDRSLSMSALRASCETGAKLFALSYYAGPAFRELDSEGAKGLLFQIHPDPSALRDLFREEMELQPRARFSLLAEKECQLSESALEELADEPRLAERIMVASSFTKDTLVRKGIIASSISVVPYGVDVEKFSERTVQGKLDGPLRVAFVGSVIQRKGISYLLDAISKIGHKHVQLTFYTRGFVDYSLLKEYSEGYVNLRIGCSNHEIVSALKSSDIFILPSLAEGFGHVIAEAMAVGLPVIASENTMARDIVTDGDEGFVIPIRSSEAIQDRLEWAIKNRAILFDMGIASSKTIRAYTWEAFRKGVRDFARNELSHRS